MGNQVNRNAMLRSKFQDGFITRDFFFHDGRKLRRFQVARSTQLTLTAAGALAIGFSAYGVGHAALDTASATGLMPVASAEQKVERMERQLAAMQARVSAIKQEAALHAARIDQRQALLSAVLSGEGEPQQTAFLPHATPAGDVIAADVIAPFKRVEGRQIALARQARETAEARYKLTARHVSRLGLSPDRLVRGAMGGPLEDVPAGAAATDGGDAQFRALFTTWKKLDSLEQGVIAIPSSQPVSNLVLTSRFGVRSDPFRGTAAMHSGIDIPGAVGTPIFATADGIVERSERSGGYGNLVEVNHGKGIQTRYGHLSKLLVAQNTRVKRGQMIGLMGSTGRSTGSHLHYEVRIDGRAVNPMPYLQSTDYLLAVQQRAARVDVAIGGPKE